jgi:TetR/AcrR family transcriptional repressor of nem operon
MLESGLEMLLERGYAGTSVQDVLERTGMPKGSFYHHFQSKEDMALQAVDLYTSKGHALMDATLELGTNPPLDRVRDFFQRLGEFYGTQGYLGCMLGALGQELSGVSPVFCAKIEECLSSLAKRIGDCLEDARREGSLSPEIDPQQLANLWINVWEGAALRSRLLRDPQPLRDVLAFCFRALETV